MHPWLFPSNNTVKLIFSRKRCCKDRPIRFILYRSFSSLGTHSAQTFRNFKRSCIMLYAKQRERPNTVATLSIVILLSAGSNSSTRCTVASVAISIGRPGRASFVTFQCPRENFSTQLWTLYATNTYHCKQEIQYNLGNPTYMDQGAAGLPKTTDYWKKSEHIY
jgi:hypothetical protein